ncbi:MAG TPA: methylenetetrahydrofolate--tRNA-(uracil(54)-C(5))-methyltransferase (FADH(2)-oxidizing) TrmFO, partial [bacterium]|nr:methylenetetrahydrofolate--tRNA-(uracil(54)-C(5))-methyltransferase (FADH(2)-oxidizing) TrmFO [bacterium]
SSVIFGNRYGDLGTGDYLNILLNKKEYTEFYDRLNSAEIHNPEHFEENKFFQGCMPIERIAKSGFDTLRFGTMKPVGFNYRDGSKPFAVIQLRRENSEGSIYNMVGFQTCLKYGEQERIFRTLPGLEKAEFARKGSMHRNSYINSPENLSKNLNLKTFPNIFISGQLTGVEGYVESIATGLIAGVNAANIINSQAFMILPEFSMINNLISYITNPENSKGFQPMNANFGLMKPLNNLIKNKKERYLKYAERSLNSF